MFLMSDVAANMFVLASFFEPGCLPDSIVHVYLSSINISVVYPLVGYIAVQKNKHVLK